jgi:hypothetical protein
MWNRKEPHRDGPAAREPRKNPFSNEDEQRVILGAVQAFTFAIALMLLLVVSNT